LTRTLTYSLVHVSANNYGGVIKVIRNVKTDGVGVSVTVERVGLGGQKRGPTLFGVDPVFGVNHNFEVYPDLTESKLTPFSESTTFSGSTTDSELAPTSDYLKTPEKTD
jgi:hypothetical protein